MRFETAKVSCEDNHDFRGFQPWISAVGRGSHPKVKSAGSDKNLSGGGKVSLLRFLVELESVPDRPDPSDEAPAGEELAESEAKGHSVETLAAQAGGEHGSESAGAWDNIKDQADESHGSIELDN